LIETPVPGIVAIFLRRRIQPIQGKGQIDADAAFLPAEQFLVDEFDARSARHL